MKTSILHLIILTLASFAISCGDDNDPINPPRPKLDRNELTMTVGECDTLTVSNATTITASASTDAVRLKVTDNKIIVTAVNVGEASITVSADNQQLSCKVKVTAKIPSSNDFAKELNDTRSRYVSSNGASMYYDTPGTLFSITKAHIIEVRNLDSNEYVRLNCGNNPINVGDMPNATLVINGDEVSLLAARAERCDDIGMWFNLVTIDGTAIVLVITDI